MTKKEKKAIDAKIDRAYRENCCGIQINMTDIPKVFAVGREAVAAGLDDEQVAIAIRGYVETIRMN